MSYLVLFRVGEALLLILALELLHHRKAAWALPALIVYGTIGAWYFLDPTLYPENYATIENGILCNSYWQVLEFLLLFRLFVPWLSDRFVHHRGKQIDPTALSAERLFVITVCSWTSLFLIAVSQMNWQFETALLPLDGRGGWLMWQRAAGADAGPFGFLISSGGYLYLLACAFFGILAVFTRTPLAKIGSVVMMLVSWPFFLLGGTRNQFLAVCMPGVFAYALFSKQRIFIRVAVLVLSFLLLEQSFRIVITHRNIGYRDYLFGQETEDDFIAEGEAEHAGLNMIEELCYINVYSEAGYLKPTWGTNYLAQLVSIVPRAIWANKPLQGIDYAKWRGFEDRSGESDIGVVATVSTGLIGQGVLEFGPWLGPIAPAFLMAIWSGILAIWWRQRTTFLRACLFLFGIGITFNLGRNITMIILWPVAFAYVIVRVIEWWLRKRSASGGTAMALPIP